MAKLNNLIKTVVITVSTNETIEKQLEQLVYTGDYGKNSAEAAERVIVFGLRRLVELGELKRDGAASPDKRG